VKPAAFTIPFCCLLLLCTLHSAAQDGLEVILTRVNTLIKKGDYAEAVNSNNRMLQLAESRNDCFYTSMATYKAAELQSFLKNNALSKKYIYDGMKKAAQCGDADTVYWLCIRHLGALYFGEQQKDSAFFYLNMAYGLIKGSQRYSRIASTTGMMAETLRHLHRDMDGAERYYNISMDNAVLSNDYEALGYACMRYGSFLCNERGKCSEGVVFTEQALKLFDANNDTEGIMFALRSLANDYLTAKNFAQSRIAMRRLLVMQDSLFKTQVAEKSAYYHELYETEKKDLELKAANTKRNNLIIAFTAIVFVTAIVLALLYNRNKLRKKMEAEKNLAASRLLRFKAVIDTEEKERERIARELHDGVGHLLSSAKLNVSAIEDMQGENIQLVNNAMQIIDEALAETRSISHNLVPAALTQLGFTASIKQLVRKLNQAGKVKVQLSMDDSIVINDQPKAIAIYRIVQELLNNTLKHASANNIQIDITLQNNFLMLVIKDDGAGFNTAGINKSKGMGWKNIYTRVELLNGSINVHSAINTGTSTTIQVPHE